MHFYTFWNSPLGRISIVCDDHGINALDFRAEEPTGTQDEKHPLLIQAVSWLQRYFAGEKPDPKELPLSIHGTEFQETVWKILFSVPYGKMITYGQIAKRMHSNMSAQAVGNAVGKNPVAIVIPCHRVVGHNGKLTGYHWGTDRKAKLLQMEKYTFTF